MCGNRKPGITAGKSGTKRGAISGGGGYETQEEAEAEMLEEFAEQAHRVLH